MSTTASREELLEILAHARYIISHILHPQSPEYLDAIEGRMLAALKDHVHPHTYRVICGCVSVDCAIHGARE